MSREQVRLELIKICERRDQPPVEILAKAKAFECYIFGDQAKPVEPTPVDAKASTKGSKKGSGNSDLFS